MAFSGTEMIGSHLCEDVLVQVIEDSWQILEAGLAAVMPGFRDHREETETPQQQELGPWSWTRPTSTSGRQKRRQSWNASGTIGAGRSEPALA
jgi:hypothetical protein